MGLNRRNFIKATGAAALTGLAGCSSNNDNSNDQTPTDNTPTTSDQPTKIEFLQSKNIDILPIVNKDTPEQKAEAGVRLEVEDLDGLQNIQFQYNDDHRDQPYTIYDRNQNEFEQGVDGKMVPISGEFPQKILAPNTGEFSVEVTDLNGNTQTRTQGINGLTNRYQADRKRIASTGADQRNLGNYTTERNWDNLTTNTEQINQMQQEWINQEAYNPLIDQIMSGEDLQSGGRAYPNYNLEGETNDPGFFDQSAVRQEDDFETIIQWYLPAIMEFDRENYGNAPSSRFERFGATLETLINEHHPTAEAQATGVNSMPAHGIFGIQDKNNEKFYLVDTTPASPQNETAVGRIGDFATSGFDPSRELSRQNLWDPFHQFKPGTTEGMSYHAKSESGREGLLNFVENRVSNNQVNYDKIFMTDEWMDEAYQVLRNGGSIDPIVEPIEEIIYNNIQAEEPNNTGIYGTLDDTRIAVSSGDQIYNKVMKQPQPQAIEDIEAMLETA